MTEPTPPPLSLRQIFSAWWPLAASWLLMGVELPAVSAVIARLGDPRVNLAAYGGIVFPLCLLVEAPVIMLLATSTALARDWASYLTLRRFMNGLGAAMTLLHAAVAFTPLWDIVATRLLDAPAATIEPGRLGMQIMTPWTWAIAVRRFQQGVLIRSGNSRAVGLGTAVRLLAGFLGLWLGYSLGWRGIVVGASATIFAVSAEAAYVAIRVRPAIADLRRAEPVTPKLDFHRLVRFHTPLALTSLLHLLALPLGSAAMGRMPSSLASLAAWPVVNGLVFLFRSVGLAYTEVTVIHIEKARSYGSLRKFALLLGGGTTAGLLLVVITPLRELWLVGVSGLTSDLAVMAGVALWFAVPHPALGAMQNLYQGILVGRGHTRPVAQAVVVALLTTALCLVVGIVAGRWTGLFVSVVATALGSIAQTLWLWRSGRALVADTQA